MGFGWPHGDDATVLEQGDRELLQTLSGPAHSHAPEHKLIHIPEQVEHSDRIVAALVEALQVGTINVRNIAANNCLMQTVTLTDAAAHMLVASDSHRLRVKVLNTSGGNLYVSTDENVSAAAAGMGNLIVIPKGLQPIVFETTQALYVAAPAATSSVAPVSFSYWSENNI